MPVQIMPVQITPVQILTAKISTALLSRISNSAQHRFALALKPCTRMMALAGFAVLLSGCGGNSSAVVDSSTPVVLPQVGENCDSAVGDDCANTGVTSILAEDAPITASVADGESRVYSVPAGSQVVLSTISGNANLYLYPNQNFSNDNIVCTANSAYVDDICSADNAQYAIVFGREASAYSISATNDCSVPSQNRWVDRQMRDYYLFYKQVPTLNVNDFERPEDLIASLRVAEVDPFSNIRDAAQQAELFAEGTSFGMGYRLRRDSNGLPRIARVYADSPMGRANVKRSDIIVSVNNIPWDDIDSTLYNDLLGTIDNPLPTIWVFRDSATNETRQIELTQSVYTINTVLHSQIITHPEYSGKIGYLVFERFLGPSESELDQALNSFLQNDVTDLILDLRYNGGGLTRIARKLISQIAGPDTDGELLIKYRNNDKYRQLDTERFFEPQQINLGLKRLVVITSNATASSSEIVINSLKPYIDVMTVGSGTAGKPYVSGARDFCGKSIFAMSAEGENARGVSVFGGIPADCTVFDDLSRDFGVIDGDIEGMVKSAAEYLVFGSCGAASSLTKLDSELTQPVELHDPDEISLPGAVGF